MKINEFISEYNKNKKNAAFNVAKLINAKNYLSIKEKRVLIDNIVNTCILYEDGVYKFNEIDKYITFTMKTIAAYTNLELSADIEDDYDELCSANLLNIVIDTFIGEYDNVNLLLRMQCDYILSGNTMEAQFGKFLTDIMDKVSDFSDSLSKKMESFDLSKLPVSTEDLTKLMEFVNFIKK